MLYKKKGFPEESELVMCLVTKVLYDSVFVRLNEYDKQGVIHISEISPGRIRNIRDFVKEGKIVICKVLRINKERGHIDLSLRRVTDMQRREKANNIKQEQKAEKIIEGIAKKTNINIDNLYRSISPKILSEYEYIFQCFEDIVENKISLEKLGIDKNITQEITNAVKEKIKPKEVKIKGDIEIEVYHSDGINILKETLNKGLNKNIEINYAGAGKYRIVVSAKGYKEAEEILDTYIGSLKKNFEKIDGIFKFSRKEK